LIFVKNSYFRFFTVREFNILPDDPSGLSIFLSLYNEEKTIYTRLTNICNQKFTNSYEILLILDGCTDNTKEEILRFISNNPNIDISIFSEENNKGQANAQNIAAKEAMYNILLKTDSETFFSKGVLNKIYKIFNDHSIGVVGGGIEFQSEGAFSVIYRTYFFYEQWLRRLEASIGYGIKVSGACVAYRKELWIEIENFEDVDQVVTFMAEKKNLCVEYLPGKGCKEIPNVGFRREATARSRMTTKGILSIIKYLDREFIVQHSIFTFFMISHKLIRYLSSPSILILFFYLQYELFLFCYPCYFIALLFFLFVFYLSRVFNKIVVSIWSSLYGQSVGVLKSITNKNIGSYKPTNQL
jgi:cellulose synthase/poly-beta-1,6-N-acetylglucosamine synthase-like glycosyltransferase